MDQLVSVNLVSVSNMCPVSVFFCRREKSVLYLYVLKLSVFVLLFKGHAFGTIVHFVLINWSVALHLEA